MDVIFKLGISLDYMIILPTLHERALYQPIACMAVAAAPIACMAIGQFIICLAIG